MVSKALIDDIGSRAQRLRHTLATEEATKHALVLPMLQALGYDVFNPEEVIPEFNADYGTKSGEKVDYAIIRDGAPVMLIECKKIGDPLDVQRASQLGRYFSVTSARIGLLTDGQIYKFFSDLDSDNLMDSTPFLEVDLTDVSQRDIQALGHFAKPTFDIEEALSAAANLKHIAGMKDYLLKMYHQPDDDFVRLLARRVFGGTLTQSRMEHFTGVAKLAIQEFVNDLMNDTLRRASSIVNSPEVQSNDSEAQEEGVSAPVDESESNPKDIVTTTEEIQGFELVRTIVSDVVDPERVFIRDTKSYCGVLLDDNNRRPICRLYFNNKERKLLCLLSQDLDQYGRRVPTYHEIESVNDIANYGEELREAVRSRMGLAG